MRHFFVFIFLISSYLLKAQNVPNPQNKITRREADSIRSVVMNRELLLNPTEASRFWPLYDMQQRELQILNRDYFIWQNQNKNRIDFMTNGELMNFLQKQNNYLQQRLEIRKKYDQQYRRILTLKQLAHLYLSEDKYARELVQYRIRKALSE